MSLNLKSQVLTSSKKYLRIALIQLMLLLMFLGCFYSSKPFEIQNVKQAVLIVDDISYERVISEYKFSFFSNSVKYQFSNKGVFSNYSNSELYEKIEIGDRITIKYVEEYGLFGKINWVVDARTETEVYRSIEDYSDQKIAFIIICVFFYVVELLFLIVVTLYVFYDRRLAFFKNGRKNK